MRSRSSSTTSRSNPTQTRLDSPVLRSLLLYLASARGVADKSLHAYRRDLEDIEPFLSRRQRTLTTAGADDYREYLQDQSRRGRSTRTVARRLAAIRVFLRFRAGDGHDVTNILQQLERPK